MHFSKKNIYFLQLALLFMAVSILLAGCSKPVAEAPDLIVLHTARLRGNVVPEGMRNNAALQHYAYIAGYVKKVREEATRTGAQVLLVDVGDSLSGSFAASVTNSANMTTFFNDLGYDAVMLGNLDMNLTTEALKPLKMPVLCPFIDRQGNTATPGTVTHAIIKKGGLEVQLLANYNEDLAVKGNESNFPSYFGGVTDSQPLRDYPALVAGLPPKKEGSIRIVECMKFLQGAGKPPEFLNTLQKLGVDAVLGHQPYPGSPWLPSSKFEGWEPPVSLSILRDNRGLSLSRADFKRVNGRWEMLAQTNLNMVANTAPADVEVEKKVAQYKPAIEKADKPVLYISKDLGEADVLALYLQALATVPGTQVAICGNKNNSVRAPWRKGSICFSDIYESLPWTNQVAQFVLPRENYEAMFKDNKIFQRYKVFASDEVKTSEKVTITTTNYLAREMSGFLGWERYPEIHISDPKPEYLFFADYLAKKYDASLDEQVKPGWAYIEPQPEPETKPATTPTP